MFEEYFKIFFWTFMLNAITGLPRAVSLFVLLQVHQVLASYISLLIAYLLEFVRYELS